MLLGDFGLLPGLTVIGLVNGGAFALLALGLVLIYRVSGVLNFAHGAVAMFSTFMCYQVVVRGVFGTRFPAFVGLLVAVLFGAALGYVIERITIRPLQGQAPLVKTIVTIGWLLALQALAGIIWGANANHEKVEVLTTKTLFTAPGNAPVSTDKFVIIVAAVAIAFAVNFLLTATPLGAQVRAVADDPTTARLWGINVNRVTSFSWMTGCAMAAVAGVLLTPQINFDNISLTILVIEGLIAAVVGGLSSLPLTLLGAFALGCLEEWPRAFFQKTAGIEKLVAVLAVVLILLIRPPKALGARAA